MGNAVEPSGRGSVHPREKGVATAISVAPGGDDGELRIILPFGALAFLAAMASLLSCYTVIFLSFVLGVEPQSIDGFINQHVQAVVMWGFALVAVWALWRDRRHHSSQLPTILGALATVILIATLYIQYDSRFELLAYVILVVSALINQNAFLGTLNARVVRQAGEIEDLNQSLTDRVVSQEAEIGRLGQFRQFLAPQVADIIVSEGKEHLLDPHRRYVACVFFDLRGFTALSEAIEPEEVIEILRGFHDRIGELVSQNGGTIGYRAGDGLMAFFNDPIECDSPSLDAVTLAVGVRSAFEDIRKPWAALGYDFGLGTGIASGYATIGLVGMESRADYTAIGSVVNLASRICDRATDGQILINHRAFVDLAGATRATPVGALEFKGVREPVEVYEVLAG